MHDSQKIWAQHVLRDTMPRAMKIEREKAMYRDSKLDSGNMRRAMEEVAVTHELEDRICVRHLRVDASIRNVIVFVIRLFEFLGRCMFVV